MDKRYLIYLSLAAAAGYGLGEMDLLEAQASPLVHGKTVELYLGSGAATAFESFLASQYCPKVDNEFNVTSGTCTVSLLKERFNGVCLTWDDTDKNDVKDSWRLSGHINWPGNFVADQP